MEGKERLRKPSIFVIVLLFSLFMLNFGFYLKTARLAVSQGTSSDWLMLQKDCQHTGFSIDSAPNSTQLKFLVNHTDNHQSSSPIIVGNKVIIAGGGSNYSLYALDSRSGKLLWNSQISFHTDATPAAYNNMVVIPSSNGYLYCFDVNNGNLIWKFRFTEGGYGNLPSPIIQNGVVYQGEGTTSIAKKRGSLYAISLFDLENETTPQLIWKHLLSSTYTSSATYSDGKILIGYVTHDPTDEYTVCLTATEGTILWEKRIGSRYSSPTVVNGRIYFGSHETVYCLTESTGEIIWQSNIGNTDFGGSPAIADKKLYVGTLSRKGPDSPAIFVCLNISNGNLIWQYQLDLRGNEENANSHPAIADDKVFLSSGYRIYAFDSENGNIIWSYVPLHSFGGSSPAISNGEVYIMDGEGYVYAFGVPEYFQLRIGSLLGNVSGADFYPVNSNAQISVNSPLTVADGIRYVFTGWTGDFVSESKTTTIAMNSSKTLFANWKLQNYLTVDSTFGNPNGE